MYKDYFALSEAPFSIAPDPRYLYMSGQHQEALAHLLYGVESDGGFVLLTGEVGTGKTTVCRCLLEKLPELCDVAFIYNPKLNEEELLATICAEFGIDLPPGTSSIKVFVDHLNAYLLDAHSRGRKSVLIIDEAQNLSVAVLEQLRLLTNLETNERKLLQIILLGQPELQELLARPELRQVASRIIARYHLRPLSRQEVTAYVNYRIAVAGSGRKLFAAATLGQIYRLSGGVPRIINLLCDRALLGAYVQGKDRVDKATVAKAAREVFGENSAGGIRAYARIIGLALLGGGAALAIAYYQHSQTLNAPKSAAPAKTLGVPELAVPPKTLNAPAERTPPAPVKALASPASSTAPEQAVRDALAFDNGDWLKEIAKSGSETAAYAALFKLWGAAYEGRGFPCRAAETQGLRCFANRGGLNELRRLNVPAVLRLRKDGGGEFFATLAALDDASASFAVADGLKADGLKKVAIGALADRWNGEYTVLWRLPPGYRDPIVPGVGGKATEWLKQALTQVNGAPVEAADLPRDLRNFQIAEGLEADGVAGPKTIIRLIARADPSVPRLTK